MMLHFHTWAWTEVCGSFSYATLSSSDEPPIQCPSRLLPASSRSKLSSNSLSAIRLPSLISPDDFIGPVAGLLMVRVLPLMRQDEAQIFQHRASAVRQDAQRGVAGVEVLM